MNNSVKKIAIVTNMYLDWVTQKQTYGGGEKYSKEIINILKKYNFDITLYQKSNNNFTKNVDDIKIIGLINNFKSHGEMDYGFSEYVNNILLEQNYDLVIYMMPELCCSENIIENSILINHGIWFDRNVKDKKYFDLLKIQLDKCKTIICVDTNYINFVRTYYCNNYNNMIYIPNFVEEKFFYKKELNLKSKLNILFPRRANIYRGSRLVKQILDNIKIDVNFIWCGYGDDEDNKILSQLSKEDSRFSFVGCDFDGMIEYYKKADIVIIPTIASEGTSLAAIESLASSNIVISTNVGGLPNIIIDNYNGFLCNNDASDIVNKLIYTIDNYKNLDYIIKNGYSTAVTAFNKKNWDNKWQNILDNKLNLYNTNYNLNNNYILNYNIERNISTERNKKIAIVTRNCVNGGVETIIFNHQKYKNIDVYICGGIIDENNKPFEYKKNLLNFFEVYNNLINYDIIISHWVPTYVQDAYYYLKQNNIKILEYVHRTDTDENNKNVINGIITHSKFLKTHLIEKFNFDKNNIHILHHPIDMDIFKYKIVKKYKIGIIGSYNIFKGIEVFIKAIKIINEKNFDKIKDYELCIYGKDDGAKNDLINLAKINNVNINFYESSSNVNELINEFEILCIPSTMEGFPLILCEALAQNAKIIASDIIGIKEFYNDCFDNGYPNLFSIFENNNFNMLSEYIMNLLNNNIKLNNFNGREYISKFYSIDKHMYNLDNILNSYTSFFKTKKRSSCIQNINDKINIDIICIKENKVLPTTFDYKNVISRDNFLRISSKEELKNICLNIKFVINTNEDIKVASQFDVINNSDDKIEYIATEKIILKNDIFINVCLNIKDLKFVNFNLIPYYEYILNVTNIEVTTFNL